MLLSRIRRILPFGVALLPAFAQLAPDLIVVNARIRTLNPRQPTAQALAVKGERIAAVGSDAEIRGMAGPATRIVDAAGRLVLPGFNDSHTHFLSGGFQLASVDLRSAATPDEFTRRVAAFAAKLPQGRWMLGGDWDHELFPAATLPRREWIDKVTPLNPVFVNRLDGHMALANTLALRLAGITKETKDPPGGLIVRDPQSGEPTGILKDAAMALVNAVIPSPSFEEKLAAARAATRHAASLGVTSVTDVSAGADIAVYQELLRRGELLTRIYAAFPLPEWQVPARAGIRQGFGGSMLRTGVLKAFADGSLGSTTALFYDAYADDPSTSGLPSDEMIPPQRMLERLLAADQAGLQICVHAIGDRANREVLDLFAEVAKRNGPRDRRFRIEHAQHIRPRDIPLFRERGVIASMQPYHAADDGRWAAKRIGAQRSESTYAFRSLLDAGGLLAFGSDWTVAPLNPLEGIWAAVTRQTLDGKNPGGWVPRQKITVEEAVDAYTSGSAYAEFMEADKGSLAPGKLADLVILSADIFEIEPSRIREVAVDLSIIGGRIVYSR